MAEQPRWPGSPGPWWWGTWKEEPWPRGLIFPRMGLKVRQGGRLIAKVEGIGLCARGWRVTGKRPLVDTDLLLVGLI